jgi:hypothetical protein
MRRTYWYVLFMKDHETHREGLPAFVQGGRRYKAIQRVAAQIGKGWKLDMAIRMRDGRPANLGIFPMRHGTVEEFVRHVFRGEP